MPSDGSARPSTATPRLTALHGSYDDAPSAGGTVSMFRNLLHHHIHQTGAGPAETFWSGLGAVRRTDLLAVGGFDGVRYPHPSIEDIELGHRLAVAGGRLRLDPTIQGTHLKRWTLRSMLWTDFARRGVPWVALQLRTRRIASTLNCSWRHRVSALMCGLAPVAVLVGAALASARARRRRRRAQPRVLLAADPPARPGRTGWRGSGCTGSTTSPPWPPFRRVPSWPAPRA